MYTPKSKFVSANRDFNQTVSWKMLSNDQCEEIFVTAAELLERTGAQVDCKEARAIFEKGGCWVDGDIVRIPSAKLEWAVRSAPSRITLCNRHGKRAIMMETENVCFGTAYGAEKIFDRKTGERRDITLEDVGELARLAEKLKDIAFVSVPGLPAGFRKETAALHGLSKLLAHSSKPIVQPVCCAKQAACATEMVAAACGGTEQLRRNPSLVLSVTCDEPRYHSAEALGVVAFAAERGIPFIYNNKLVSGQTAPASPAGTLVLALANHLVALTLAQLVKEGAPVIAGGHFTTYDVKNKMAPFGAPEAALIGSGFANLTHWLKLPNAGVSGITDSPISDAQSGAELAIGLLTSALAGTNLVAGSLLESGKTVSLSVLAMNEEVMAHVYRIMKSFAIDEDRKAVGVYDIVGPGGSYLGEEHTGLFFKSEQFWPKLFSRLRIDDWKAAGSKPMGRRATEYVNVLLEEPDAFSCDGTPSIEAILAKAEMDL